MRILITGGTGFIGQHTVRRLHHEGHDLLLLVQKKGNVFSDLDRITFIEGDILDIASHKERIASFAPDALVHLAWQGIPDYGIENCRKNLAMSINLISVISEMGCKTCIVTGSCWEYGRSHGELREDMAPVDKNVFCATKTSIFRMGNQIALERGMRFVWLRLFYVYGPGQRGGSLIPTIIRAIGAGEAPAIQNPQNRNDFVFVEDVANAISKALQEEVREVFNIGSGRATSLAAIMEIISDACGSTLQAANDDTESRTKNEAATLDFWADISKARRELKWEPQVSITEGIHRLIQAEIHQ